MFNDATMQFLRAHETPIVNRWSELSKQELSPDFLAGRWFQGGSLKTLYGQIIDAFESRVYRELNRTIEHLTRHPDTPSPLDVKALLTCFARAAVAELETTASDSRDAALVRADVPEMGRSLKRVYSERFGPRLMDLLAEHRDDLRERWLRDLPTARISDHFSILSAEDIASFVDQTFDAYDAVLRGRELDQTQHPHDPNTPCTVLDAWLIRQVDYFNPKGFSLICLLRAVEHLPLLMEPLLAASTTGDEWAYRVSLLLLVDARNTLSHTLADTYMERFSKNFYGEVGIMLHRIKNKLTSVPTTMQTVLAVSDNEEYQQMFEPMIVTTAEAELLAQHDQLTQAVDEAQQAVLAAVPVNGSTAGDPAAVGPALDQLRDANTALRAFLAEHQTEIDNVKMMKLDVGGVEMVLEMLGIVLEGGKQTEELTKDLQLRMNEMYEREPPRREALEVSDLVAAATHEAEVDARAKDINFVVEDTASGLRIFGVRRDIGRPFVQVIDNAIKYTPSGGTVTVRLQPDGEDHVLFSCRDTGIGIPPGEEEQVFSLCERCSNAKEFANGTGTGLYHDRITVMHHNGEMWLESAGLNNGTTMYIRLPLLKEAVEATSGE